MSNVSMRRADSPDDTVPTASDVAALQGPRPMLGLAIVHARSSPERVGEVALFGATPLIVGRGGALDDGSRARFVRQRPLRDEPQPPLDDVSISRVQLRVRQRGQALFVERLGRASVTVGGRAHDAVEVRPGDVLAIGSALLLLCVERAGLGGLAATHPFGGADDVGLVGESPAIWTLRNDLRFAADAGGHVLVVGPSGAGKELVASAIHRLSSRAHRAFVARNAATLPAGLVDAELFGNVRNYPNAGMPEREGLVGAAHEGTLFLDEIADLPPSAHASLLRILDGDAEYHRLGEARTRRAAVRFVGATNRSEGLREDLAARFRHRLEVPGLDARREDVPLLIDALLRKAARDAPAVVARFVDEAGRVSVSPEVVERLVTHEYRTHVRELERLLWAAMASSSPGRVSWPPRAPRSPAAPLSEDPRGLSSEAIRSAVVRGRGNVVRAARALGVSRYALYRLLRQHNLDLDELRRHP